MERDTSMIQINGTNCNTSPALVLPWSIALNTGVPT